MWPQGSQPDHLAGLCIHIYVCISFLKVMLLGAPVMGMAGNLWCPLGSVWICGFIIKYLPDHVPGSHWVSAINGCFCGRIMDLPSQSETSEIDRH